MAKSYSEIKKSVLGKNYDINKNVKNGKKSNKSYEEIKTDVMNGRYNFSYVKADLEKKIGFDTFSDDVSSVITNTNATYEGWQDPKSLWKNKAKINLIQPRMSAYKEYVKLFGGNESDEIVKGIDDIQKYNRQALDNWDSISEHYGKYKNADEWKTETDTLSNLYSLSSKDIESKMDVKTYTHSFDIVAAYKKAKDAKITIDFAKKTMEKPFTPTVSFPGAKMDFYEERLRRAEEMLNYILASTGYSTYEELQKDAIAVESGYKSAKSGIAYTTVDGQDIKWEDLHNDAVKSEFEQDVSKRIDVNAYGKFEKKDVNYSHRTMGTKTGGIYSGVYIAPEYEDAFLYNYINGDQEARDNGLLIDLMSYNTWEDIKNKHFTEEEKKIFNALWKAEGPSKAKEYLSLLDSELTQKQLLHEYEFYSEMAKEDPVGASFASVFGNFGNNALALPMMGIDLAEDGNIDNTSRLYAGRRNVQTIRGTVEDMIDNPLGQFAYRYGMDIADNVMARAMGGYGKLGGVSKAITLGSQVSGSVLDHTLDAKERGLSDGQSLMLGAIAGVAEGFFESKAFDALMDTKTLSRSAWGYFTNNLKTELVGELGTELTNDLADHFVAQDLSKLNLEYQSHIKSGMSEKDAFLKVAGGVALKYADVAAGTIFSTGVMSGGPAVIGGISQHSQNKAIGQDIKVNDRVGDVFDIVNNPEMASAYEAYTKYANKGVTAENISDAKLGRLYTNAYLDAQETAESKKSTTAQKDSAKTTMENLDAYVNRNATSTTSSGKMIGISSEDRVGMYKDADYVSALVESGLESAEGTEAHTLATEYSQKLKDGKKVSAKEVAKLQNALDNEVRAEEVGIVTEYLNEKGIDTSLAEIVTRQARGETITEVEAEAIESSGIDIAAVENAIAEYDGTATETTAETSAEVTIPTEKVEELGLSPEAVNVVERKAEGKGITLSEAENLIKNENALNVLADNGNDELVNTVKAITDEEGVDKATLFLSLYDGKTDLESFSNAFNLAVTKSEANFPFEDIRETKGVLSDEQVKKIYAETRIKADQNKRAEFQKLVDKTAKMKAYKGVVDDSVIDYENKNTKGKVNWKDISPERKKEITFVKGLAQIAGLNLKVVTDGKKQGFNGAINIERNTIYIDIFAEKRVDYKNLESAIIPAFSHELTHWMEHKSPVLFRKVSSIVFSTLQRVDGLTESERIAKEVKRLTKKGIFKETDTDAQKEAFARSEIVARGCEDMLSRSKVGREMFYSLEEKEQKTFVDKIKDVIKSFKEWINGVLKLYDTAAAEAKALRRFDAEMDKLSKLWDKMLIESIEVNQALEKSGTFENKMSADGNVLLQAREIDDDGNSYWQIETDKDIFKGIKSVKGLQEAAFNYILNGDKGNKIIDLIDGKRLEFIRVSAEEYVYGKASHSLSTEEYKQKMRISTSIIDLVENASIQYDSPDHKNHKLFPDGFKNYQGRVGIDDTIFRYIVRIGKAKNGMIFYDINLEVDGRVPRANRTSPIKSSTSSNSIRNSERNVNTNISDRDSLDRELSEGQQEYFKDSAVRNENGNLLVMYRGDSSEVTVFDRKKTNYSNLYGRGFYFTKSKSHAEQYGTSREFYLNIKNPLSPKQNVITKKQMLNFLKAIENDGEDYDLYNYGQEATAESVLTSVWGKGDFEMLQDISAGAIGDLVAAVELFNEVNGTSYDGIILPTETVTFNSEQAKLTSNLNPTDNEDIRFSERDTEYLELAKNPEQNEAKLRELVDEVAKEAGYTTSAYHGTPNNDFTVFDKNRIGKGTDQYGAGFYFASNKDATSAYGTRVIDSLLSLKNPIKIDASTEEGANLIDGGFEHLLTEEQAYEVIKRLPNIYDSEESPLGDYYDSYWENGAEDWMIEDLASNEFNRNIGYLDSDLFRDYPNELHEALRDVVGYDGVEVTFANGDKFYIAWFDNQMKSADLVTYDDDGNVIPLSERFNKKNEDIRYSERDDDYSYESIISKPDMILTEVGKDVPSNKADIVFQAIKNAKSVGFTNENGNAVVHVDDIADDVIVPKRGLVHGLDRRLSTQAPVLVKVGEVLKNSIRINELNPRSENVKNTYVLIGAAIGNNNELYVASFVVNRFSNEVAEINVLYSANAKKESAAFLPKITDKSATPTDSTISIAELLDYVNKLFPDILPESILKHFGYEARPDGALGKSTLFSERDDTTVYDILGENERIRKENEAFKTEIERLNERLKLERKVTHGNYFNEKQLGMVAGHLRKISNSSIDKLTLMKSLKEVYSFIAQSEELTWEDVFTRCYDIADAMIKEAKPITIVDDYSKHLLREIRNTRISLDDAQKAEAQHHFGKNWNRSFMGKVIISNDGINIDSQWQEWSNLYPEVFSADTNSSDMISELYDIIESLKSASEIVDTYGMEEQTRWLANEIYNQYWNISPIRTTADRYDGQIKRLNSEHRRAMKEYREAYETRLNEQIVADDIHYGKKISDLRSKNERLEAQRKKAMDLVREIRTRKNNEITLAKQHGREMMDKYKENAERKTLIQGITSDALSLNEKLINNSKDKHVPEVMKGPVVKLLTAINLSSKTLLEKGIPTTKDIKFAEAFREVNSMLADANNFAEGLEDFYGNNLADTLKLLSEAAERLVGDNSYVINSMSIEELKALKKLIKHIKSSISKIDEFLAVNHSKGIIDLALNSSKEMDELGALEYKGKIKQAMSDLDWNNTTPYYAFRRYGESAMKIFESFMDGDDKIQFKAKEVSDFTKTLYTDKDIREWEKKTYDFTIEQIDGRKVTFTMSLPRIMELYCSYKQEDASKHFARGITLKKDDIAKTPAVVKNIVLSNVDYANIVSVLDKHPKAKKVAESLHEYMGREGGKLLDEVSMARFGIKTARVKNYYPLRISVSTKGNASDDSMPTANKLFSLINAGFAKNRVPEAGQSIEIGSIFDTFANHMAEVITYNAMALPILDAMKWYRYKGTDDFNNEFGVKQSIINAFGDNGDRYFTQLIEDINGVKSTARDGIYSTLLRNFKIATVGASLKTALLQPTAYPKAFSLIDAKYLIKGFRLSELITKKNSNRAKEHCGIALRKAQGYGIGINIGRGLANDIKNNEGRLEKIRRWSMKLAEKGDEFTFGCLWNACELEIRDTRKDLKVGSKEFYDVVGKRLREVVYATQVADSTLTRCPMMRSEDGKLKEVTMFMSEPILANNIVHDAFLSYSLDKKRIGKDEAKAKHKSRIARVLTGYALTNALAAVVETAFSSLWNKDDDEEFNWFKEFLNNWVLNMGLLGKIPYFKEFVSQWQGYDTTRTETQAIKSFFDAFDAWKKVFVEGKAGQAPKAIKNTIRSISDLSGLPFYTVYKQMVNFRILDEEDLNEMFEDFID